jgi:hypothetical protein
MIAGIQWFIKRYPRIAIVIAAVCWFAVPVAALSGLDRWHYAITRKMIVTSPGVESVVTGISALRAKVIESSLGRTCHAVALMLWFAAPLLAMQYLALRTERDS